MKIYTAEDFAAILSTMPDISENAAAINRLMEMRQENSVVEEPYTFEVDFATGVTQGSGNLFPAPAAAGGTSQGNFLVDTSSPFMLIAQSYQADVAGAAVTVSTRPAPNVVITIQDQSSNRNWQNGAVPIPSIFGLGTLPFFLPKPRLIPANTNVQMILTNYDAASVPNIRLSFIGYRLYAAGGR